MESAISANSLNKAYGNVRALSNLTLEIPAGTSFGFLGPNGAGKTTFVKILLNLVSPDSGFSKIFGSDSKKAESRKRVGFLPENMPAYPFLSVEEFLKFHSKLIELNSKRAKEGIEKNLKLTGMYKNRKKKMGELSKGMRQRTGIAQALLGNPGLLILDEPTSGLDPIGIKDVRDILLQEKEKGTTIFLNSHLLSEIEKTCDKVAILDRGKIIHSTTSLEFSEAEVFLEIKGRNITDSILEKIDTVSSKKSRRYGDSINIFLDNKRDSLKVHEIILQNGGELHSLAWKGESLEEIFYRLVKGREE